MRGFRRIIKALFHQSLVAQAVTAMSALVTVAFLARGLSTVDYAHYAVATAIWGIGNAVVGTGTGTRIAKMSAQGGSRIRFQRSEFLISLAVAIVSGLYIFSVRGSAFEATLVGVCMISFVVAEASTSFEIGSGRFNRYLVLLGVRALVPPTLLLAVTMATTINFTMAVSCVLAGNLASLMFWPSRWSLAFEYHSTMSGHAVGAMNMGLWTIASADRLVLERTVGPLDLATYALIYGLSDRISRSLSNAYIAKNLRKAFNGETRRTGWKFYVLSAIIATALVPVIQLATAGLSGNRYSAPLFMTLLIAAAGLFMFWSAPHYVKLLASGDFKPALLCIFLLASLNVLGNILLANTFGSTGAAALSTATYGLWLLWLLTRRQHFENSRNVGSRHIKIATH